jgi:hypothetical protein
MSLEENNDKWTIPALHEYFDRVTSDLEDKLMITIKKDEEAVKTARESMEHRLDGMNEIRKQLNEQANTFITKEIYEAKHDQLISKVEGLQKIVFVGLGVWVVLQLIISVVLLLIFNR